MNTKEALLAIVELQASQASILQAIADDVRAMYDTLLFHYPEIEDDLKENRELAAKVGAVSLRSNLAILDNIKQAISQLPD